jgi:uncharacterized membrane protein YphA (DoxX/SURF4 family)
MSRNTIIEIIASLLVLLFIYAALSKFFDFDEFRLQLGKSPFITNYAGAIAWILPIFEIILGLALIYKRTRLIGFYASLFLMTSFTAYIFCMLHYSYYIPCSCGGILSKMGWNAHFWFNLGFVAISITGIYLETNYQVVHSPKTRPINSSRLS